MVVNKCVFVVDTPDYIGMAKYELSKLETFNDIIEVTDKETFKNNKTKYTDWIIIENIHSKPYSLVLDHADNINTHGTITNLLPIGKRVSKGETNTYTHRRCPQCESACEIKATSCEECGYEFPVPRRVIDHDGKPADLDIMGDGGKWHTVHFVAYNAHIKKGTKEGEFPPTMRVTYICETEEFSEWVCVEHPERGIARRRAVKWLQERNKESLPSTVQEALELKYKEPTRIRVIPDGNYKRISAYEFV